MRSRVSLLSAVVLKLAGLNTTVPREGSSGLTPNLDKSGIMSINLRGVFLCSKAVLPSMLDKGWGRIINIASASAITPSVNAAYCASKGGVVSLTRSMALQLSPRGITVNAIAPGPVLTEMTSEMFNDPHVREHVLGKSLVGKIGEPSDVAAAALYLASDEASFVSGSILTVG
jgi:NAD(P)-dependent dehydrogenase (short-subunit alcohol dehydrogenase family)